MVNGHGRDISFWLKVGAIKTFPVPMKSFQEGNKLAKFYTGDLIGMQMVLMWEKLTGKSKS